MVKRDTKSNKNVEHLSKCVPLTRQLAPGDVNQALCGKKILGSKIVK